jgi:hypothetical protein
MTRENSDRCYATISRGSVLLWKHGWNSPLCTVARDAISAVVYGEDLVVSFRDGRSVLYRITASGSSAYPIRTLR